MKVLIVDHAWRGHRLSHLSRSADYLQSRGHEVIVGLPPEGFRSDAWKAWFADQHADLQTVSLPLPGGGRTRQMWRWVQSLQEEAGRLSVDLVVHLWADRILAAWCFFRLVGCRRAKLVCVVGRMPPSSNGTRTRSERWIEIAHAMAGTFGLVSGTIQRIGRLHGPIDSPRTGWLHHLGFRWVPDPVLRCHGGAAGSAGRAAIPSRPPAPVALVAGDLSARKEIPRLLSLWSAADSFRWRVVFAGDVDRTASEAIGAYQTAAAVRRGSICLRLTYLSQEELCRAITEADVLILGFDRQWTSSGMLGQAVLHKTPVVTWGNAYVMRMVRQFGVGQVCLKAPSSLVELETACDRALCMETEWPDPASYEDFLGRLFDGIV